MYHENQMKNNWIEMLCEENGVETIEELTVKMIDAAIEDALGATSNEHIWVLGSPDDETAVMHETNTDTHREYAAYLEGLKEKMI